MHSPPVILSAAKDLGIEIQKPRSFVAALLRMTGGGEGRRKEEKDLIPIH